MCEREICHFYLINKKESRCRCQTVISYFQGLPCHLYFDLEFNKRENPDKNEDEMVDLLIQVIFDAVKEKYSLEGNDDWVVELDSSNAGWMFNGRFYLVFHLCAVCCQYDNVCMHVYIIVCIYVFY